MTWRASIFASKCLAKAAAGNSFGFPNSIAATNLIARARFVSSVRGASCQLATSIRQAGSLPHKTRDFTGMTWFSDDFAPLFTGLVIAADLVLIGFFIAWILMSKPDSTSA